MNRNGATTMDSKTRTKIDNVWQGMWNNQMADPKTNILQITYLLFIKMLDEQQIKKERNAIGFGVTVRDPLFKTGVKYADDVVYGEIKYDDLRWQNFAHFDTEKMFVVVRDYVFPFIRSLHQEKDTILNRCMKDAKLAIPNGRILEKVIRGLDDDDLILDNKEIMGDVYEYLLDQLSINGDNGQFRTPRHIIRMMVQLMKPQLGEMICDPAMGSAGFLMESAQYINDPERQRSELNSKANRELFNATMFSGNETDEQMLTIAAMNMYLHEVDDPQFELRNSLTDDFPDEYKYDLILANPPFSGSIDANDLSKSITDFLPTKSTELLFMSLFRRLLKIGGRCASIVPVGVVNNTNEKAYTILRKELVEHQKLRAIIYMPSGIFRPYSGVQTAIIIYDKTDNGGTDRVWLYNMTADGYSLDDKRAKVKENDIPDIIHRFANLEAEAERTPYDQSFFVTKEDIVKNGYVLSLNKYQKKVIVKKEFRPTSEILASIQESEAEFQSLLAKISEEIS